MPILENFMTSGPLSALAVLEDTSRLLLTIGVGLFLAYLLLIIGANIVGFLHRRVAQTIRREHTTSVTRAQQRYATEAVPARRVARVFEREAL